MQNKQNLFQTFHKQLDNNSNFSDKLTPKTRNAKRSKTMISPYENSIQKNISLDSLEVKSYQSMFFSSIPLLKKSITHQQLIYYGSTNKQEILNIVFAYLTKIITQQKQLKKDIQNMNFQTLQKNSIWIKDSSQNKQSKLLHEKTDYSKQKLLPLQLNVFSSMEDYLNQTKLTKSVSIQMGQSAQSHVVLITPYKQLPLQKNENLFLDIYEVKSQNLTASNTSFEHQFDEKTLQKKNKELLHQVSIYFQKSQISCNQSSQISLKISPSLQSSGWSHWSNQMLQQKQSLLQIAQKKGLQFSINFLQTLYSEPQPFLISISLIYLLKYLYHTQKLLTMKNVTVLLTISLLISYKIYYDEQLLGLIEFLSQDVLMGNFSKQQLIKLQRYYLHELQYEAVISNQEFYKMLTIIGETRKNKKNKKALTDC